VVVEGVFGEESGHLMIIIVEGCWGLSRAVFWVSKHNNNVNKNQQLDETS